MLQSYKNRPLAKTSCFPNPKAPRERSAFLQVTGKQTRCTRGGIAHAACSSEMLISLVTQRTAVFMLWAKQCAAKAELIQQPEIPTPESVEAETNTHVID